MGLGLGKILIATGSLKNNDTANHSWKYATNEVELLDPQSRTLCKVKNYPVKISKAAGGFFRHHSDEPTSPLLCGGMSTELPTDGRSCYILKNGTWHHMGYRFEERWVVGMATVPFDLETLWMLGGQYNLRGGDHYIRATRYIYEGGPLMIFVLILIIESNEICFPISDI